MTMILTIDHHTTGICKKVSRKIYVLARVVSYINLREIRILINASLQLHFSQLIWSSHNRTNNDKINKFHECHLRIIYNKQSSFNELLEKGSSISIHGRNIKILAAEFTGA